MERLRAQDEELNERIPADQLLTQYFLAQGWLKKPQTAEETAAEEETLAEWAPTISEKWE